MVKILPIENNLIYHFSINSIFICYEIGHYNKKMLRAIKFRE